MTTTRALAVAAYVAAVAAPAAADWRAIADSLYAALPVTRGAAAALADAPAGSTPRWFADWKLGKLYSLDSLAVTFQDGVQVRCNLAKAPGKLPRIAAACRVAVAFYRAQTGRDSVPAFASLVAASDGAAFDAVACSDLTADLRRTAYVPAPVRPSVTAEAIARMERELERRRAGLATAEAMPARVAAFYVPLCLSPGAMGRAHDELAAMKESAAMAEAWRAAIAAGEAELDAMRAAIGPGEAEPVTVPCEAEAEPVAPSPIVEPVTVEPAGPVAVEPAAPAVEPSNDDAPVPPMPGAPAPAVPASIADSTCTPVEGIRARTPVEGIGEGVGEAEPVAAVEPGAAAHIEPLAICPAVGLPCKADCGFRPTCGLPHPVEAMPNAHPVEGMGEAESVDPVEAIEAEPVAALCAGDEADDWHADDASHPVVALCLSDKARAALFDRLQDGTVPAAGRTAKGGAWRLTVADAMDCAGLASVRFVGMPRKAYTRRIPVEAISIPVVEIRDVPPAAFTPSSSTPGPIVYHAAPAL